MNGLTRGIQLIADFFALLLKAIKSGNYEALGAATVVIEAWLSDTVNVAGVVKISPWVLLTGGDPWKNSRIEFQKFQLDWKERL